MHFDFTISLGQVSLIVAIIAHAIVFLRPLKRIKWQHDVMWNHWQERFPVPKYPNIIAAKKHTAGD